MSRSFHMSTSIKGLLSKTDDELEEIISAINDDWGRPYCSVKLLRWDLRLALNEGRELLPDDRCDNFDPKKGCLGHPHGEPSAPGAAKGGE